MPPEQQSSPQGVTSSRVSKSSEAAFIAPTGKARTMEVPHRSGRNCHEESPQGMGSVMLAFSLPTSQKFASKMYQALCQRSDTFHGQHQGARLTLPQELFLCTNSLSGPLKPPRHAKFWWQPVCLPVTSTLWLLPQAPSGWIMPALPSPGQAELGYLSGQQSSVPTPGPTQWLATK